MYYENFEMLCKRDDTKPSVVSKETGISTATLTSWKQGKYTPKQDKLQLIADFFNVSVDYLMTGEEKKKAERPKELYTKEDLELLALIKKLNEKQRNLIVETIKSFAPQND